MEGYEHLIEEFYSGWIKQTKGLDTTMEHLLNCKSLIMRIDLSVHLFDKEIKESSLYPVILKFAFIDISDVENYKIEKGNVSSKLGGIDNSGFADDWFDSIRGLYIILEEIIRKFNNEISFEFEDFEKALSDAIDKLIDTDCQAIGSIYIKSKHLPELTKLKSVADYLDRHQLDLDIFEQCNCTEGNMSEAEKYICNELIEKPGNRNLEAILDEIRTQF